jgi:hypothetical protein
MAFPYLYRFIINHFAYMLLLACETFCIRDYNLFFLFTGLGCELGIERDRVTFDWLCVTHMLDAHKLKNRSCCRTAHTDIYQHLLVILPLTALQGVRLLPFC